MTEPPKWGLFGDGSPPPKAISDMTREELCILIEHYERLIVVMQKQIDQQED